MRKYQIVSHYSKETGHFRGYSLEYRFLPFIWMKLPFFKDIPLFKDMSEVESELRFLLELDGVVKSKSVYE